MKAYAEKLYTDLAEELELIHDLGTVPVKRLAAAVSTTAETISKLKRHLAHHPPGNEQEEIEFFKHWKPLFTAEQYYALEKFTIETNRPLIDSQALKTYYEQELAFINRFFRQQQFLYQYYKFEFTELDQVLFLRANDATNIVLPETPDLDPQFSTKGDHLFAKFIAYEKLQEYLLDEIATIQRPAPSGALNVETEKLVWTGGAVNLTELAYGIWLTGQLNDGNASITHIIAWLEANLHIKIGRAHRRWETIAARKRLSITKYLDQMAEAIRKRLDDENGR